MGLSCIPEGAEVWEVMLVQSQPVLCSPGGAGRALAVQEGQRVGLAEPHLRCESLQHSLLH